MRVPLIYHQQPLFGFDIGSHTVKVMQLRRRGSKMEVVGYGYAEFPAEAIIEGIMADPDLVVAAVKPLLHQLTYGKITAKRVAISLPAGKVFTRMLKLPKMTPSDIQQAVTYEAEQYVPVPLPDLYIDFELVDTTPEGLSVLMVAAPRAIVDSYLKVFELLDLQVAIVQSSLTAASRAIMWKHPLTEATLIADIGAHSIDITVYDSVTRLADTIALGGHNLTEALSKSLGIEMAKASDLKYKVGIKKSDLQPKVVTALQPILDQMVQEVRRIMKYYTDNGGTQRPIKSMILTGGTAAMPGLQELLQQELGITVQIANTWNDLTLKHIQHINQRDAAMYATSIGLALLEGQA